MKQSPSGRYKFHPESSLPNLTAAFVCSKTGQARGGAWVTEREFAALCDDGHMWTDRFDFFEQVYAQEIQPPAWWSSKAFDSCGGEL